MSNPLETKVPPPTSTAYQPFSAKLPTQFGGKWPAWPLKRYIWYGFYLIRYLQDAVKKLETGKVAWRSNAFTVAAQANGAPKRGPSTLASWVTIFYRWNWDRQKEMKTLAAKVAELESQVAALSGSAGISIADVKDEIDKAGVRAER